MSQEVLEERVGKVELELARQGDRLTRMESDGTKTLQIVERMAERDARRPEGLTWKQFGAGVASTIGTALLFWAAVNGLIDHSQAIVDLTKRMDQAEWKYGWAARVEP